MMLLTGENLLAKNSFVCHIFAVHAVFNESVKTKAHKTLPTQPVLCAYDVFS